MRWWKTWWLALLLPAMSGCVAVKYNGFQDLAAAHPKGFEDAVNGSHYRDGSSESEDFMRAVGRYIAEMEFKLESRRD
tara:strand:- start:340 stop:573 length:234 start_codon:yes stop_codon:yes gene_type:complete